MVLAEQPSRAAPWAPYWLMPSECPQPCPSTTSAPLEAVGAAGVPTPPGGGQTGPSAYAAPADVSSAATASTAVVSAVVSPVASGVRAGARPGRGCVRRVIVEAPGAGGGAGSA